MRTLISLSSLVVIAAFVGGHNEVEAQAPAGSKPPAAAALRPYVLPEIQSFRLANGMRVLLVERHSLPIVSARFVVDAGAMREPAEKNGLAYLTADLLSEGAASLTGAQIAERMADLGASFGTSANNGSAYVGVTALSNVFPQALTLAATALTTPTLAESEFSRMRNQAVAAYQQSMSSANAVASKVFWKAIYDPATAYSRLAAGTAASLATLTRADVVGWHKLMYAPGNTTLVLIGDLTVAKARMAAEEAVGKWTNTAPALAPYVGKAIPVTENRVILVDRPGSVQSAILIGQPTVGYESSDLLAMTAAARVLGGTSSARLNSNLREKRGWTYGAFSTFNPLKGVGAFYASSSVRTNATDSSIAEAVREYRRLASEPVPASELSDQLTNVVASFPSSVQTVQGLMGRLNDVVVYGLPLDYYSTYRERLAAINSADVSRIAASLLKPNALTIVAVGDLKTIEAPLRALNLGTVEVWDADGHKVR